MPEWTPGTWKARHRCIGAGPHDDEQAGLGWEIDGPEEPMRGQFAKAADAHLVAASPDLYDALYRLVRVNEEHDAAVERTIGRPPGWKDQYLDQAREALAKARGES